jgi:hypothetical protein
MLKDYNNEATDTNKIKAKSSLELDKIYNKISSESDFAIKSIKSDLKIEKTKQFETDGE